MVDTLNHHANGYDKRDPELQRHAEILRAAATKLDIKSEVRELLNGSFEVSGELAEWLADFAKFAGVTRSAAFKVITALGIRRITNERKVSTTA